MDVIDPHLLNDEDAPARAQALAQFVHEHQGSFGRFEMIIFESKSDENGKRLNLMDDQVRAEVAAVTTHGHLRHLFESA